MLPSKAKQILSTNLRLLSGGTDTQAFRARIAKRTGGTVSPRTIGNMMSGSSGNPTLESIEAVAAALGIEIAALFTENLGRTPHPDLLPAAPAASARTRHILQRLTELERCNATPPPLYALIEHALDLVQPRAGGNDYSGLNDL